MGKTTKKAKLLEKARKAHTGPGVYRMLDKNNQIIYIGKAKNLRARIRTYFQESKDTHPKTAILVSKIESFEVILTDSEAEALILENILIKKHKPRYNVLLKDDKSYPYLIVDYSHSFPKLIYTRKFRRTKDIKVFGPFVSAGAIRRASRFLNHTFKLRDCSNSEFANRSRPCMNYQIGICSAPCTNEISQEDYIDSLDDALKILQGGSQSALVDMESRMDRYSEEMQYEEAARIRDQISGLKELLNEGEQIITSNNKNKLGKEDKDVIAIYLKDSVAAVTVLFVRSGRLIDRISYEINSISEEDEQEILSRFLAQFYLTRDSLQSIESETDKDNTFLPGTELNAIPPEILISKKIPDLELFQESFDSLGVRATIKAPSRGGKAELISMAEKNAKEACLEYLNQSEDIYRTLGELKTKLKLQNYPRRIECFDISNLGDTGIVASRVTFIEGKPDKNLYRRYKMKSVRSQNDFEAMREVLTRRLTRSSQYASQKEKEELPDLLIVDGGKGQLSMAVEVFKDLDITGVDLVSLAKAKTTRNFQGEDVERTQERVFKPGRMNPIGLRDGSGICRLMQRVRDEAHRFAITFQRAQRKIKKSSSK